MPKSVTQRALEERYTNFLVTVLNSNNTEDITKWVEHNIINDNLGTDAKSKIAFYEAEKYLLSECIDRGLYDKLTQLLNAIDNKKFNQEFKDHPNYSKLKANECTVLAGAIIKSKKSLEENNTMHKELGNLLHAKHQELKSTGYDINKLTTIDTALQIVHFEESNTDVTLTGDD